MKKITGVIINGKEFNNETPKEELYDEILIALENGQAYGDIKELVNLYYYGKIEDV